MKKTIQSVLQRLLGFRRYLYWFARFKLVTLRWDKKESDFFGFLEMVQPGSRVLDIGANLGLMAVPLAQRVGGSGKVWAFEPMPDNLEILRKIVTHYPQVEVVPVAVGPKPGEVELVLPVVSEVKMQGLSHVVHPDLTDFNTGPRFRAEQIALDSWQPVWQTTIQAIKLDVENYEFEVLKGAQNLIARDRPVIYTELWDNANRQNCLNFFAAADYLVYVRSENRYEIFLPGKHRQQNFYAIPTELADKLTL